MKKLVMLFFAGFLVITLATDSYAQTKRELQFMIKEFITDEEYKIMLKIRKETGRHWIDIFDNSIEPLREEEIHSNESARKYILPAKGEDIRPVQIKPMEKEKKSALEVNSVPIVREQDVKPINVRQEEKKEKKVRLYPREYKYKERLRDARARESQAKKDAEADAAAQGPEVAEGGEEKTLREKLKEVRTLEKRNKLVDRKPRTYRSYERRKKVEDYNRTGKENRFGGKRVDEEYEDRGFSTRAFKQKPFGSKVIYEEEQDEMEKDN